MGTPRETLADRAHRLLKSQILNAELAPDTVIDEPQIAAQLGSSRTPVRQAIARLADEGFVRVLPQRGTLVHRITQDDVEHVYLVRMLNEPAVNQLAAARITPAQLAHIAGLARDFERGKSDGDYSLHTQLHIAIAEVAGVPRLTRLIAELHEKMHWYLAVRHAQHGIAPPRDTHAELLSALGSGSTAQARQVTLESMQTSRSALLHQSRTESIELLFAAPGQN